MNTNDVLPVLTSEDDVLTFGKHKGKTVSYVLDFEPGYIVWLAENNVCQVSADIFNEAEIYDMADREYDLSECQQTRTYGDLDD